MTPYRPTAERLEDRLVPNSQWGLDGPPLKMNTNQEPAALVSLVGGDAAGAAKITFRDEVDLYRFTPSATGFYALSVDADFDAVVAVYTKGAKGKLLGYADFEPSGTEQITVYLEAGQTYFLAISNFITGDHGLYDWAIDDVDPSPGNPVVSDAKRMLYINFDGASLDPLDLQTWDDDWEFGTAAEFDPIEDGVEIQPFLHNRDDREEIISGILDRLQTDLEPFGVRVVRLDAGASAVEGDGATTIFAGRATLEDLPYNHFRRDLYHVAGDIDVGNDNLTDIAFVDDEKNWGPASRTALAMTDVFLHEAGHTYGLFHVRSHAAPETMGLRYNVPQYKWVVDTGYLNSSFYFLEGGGGGSQNSFQEIARVFGVGEDLPPPPPALLVSSSSPKQRSPYHSHGVPGDLPRHEAKTSHPLGSLAFGDLRHHGRS